MRRNLKEMVVVITGASAGIGLSLAETLAARGAKLALCARRFGHLEELRRRLPGDHLSISADVSRPEDCRNIVDQTIARFGRIDTLVCNAGFGIYRPVAHTTPEETRSIFATNVFGTTDCIYSALPHMLKQNLRDDWRGQVMIVSSICGRRGIPYIGTYSATKAAQLALGEALRIELGPLKIAVSTVHPITTGTEFGQVARSKGEMTMPGGPVKQTVEVVARRMAGAIEKPCAEVWPHRTAGWVFGLNGFFPSLVDRIVARYARRVERHNGMDVSSDALRG
jgi:short-subunit dehydrogenase